jgi:hypothetical protein
MPKLLEMIGGTEKRPIAKKLCRTCALAVPLTIKVGLSKVGNKKNYWSILRKLRYVTNLEQMFKRTATDLITIPTQTQHRLKWVLKNAKFLSDGCCCLTDMGNKTFFRITWRWVNHLCHANFLAVPPNATMLMKRLNGNNPLNQRVISFSYCLWHAWRVSYFEIRNQNVINVCTAIKSTSKWSPSPGLNSPTPTWHTV